MRSPLLAAALAFCLGTLLPPSVLSAPLALVTLPAFQTRLSAPIAFAAAGWVARSSAASTLRVVPLIPGSAEAGAPLERDVLLEGVVAGAPERFADRVRFTLRDRSGQLVLVWAASPQWPLALGDRVRVPARLRQGEGARNPGGRDPAATLAARGVGALAHARGPPIRLGAPSPLSRLEVARRDFAALTARTLPAREAGLTVAISTGDRGGIDAATNDAFARSGLAHVLSVSGLHLSVVVYGLFRALAAALTRVDCLAARLDARRAAAVAAIPFAALYAIATGASVPVVRSAIATGVGFLAVALQRESRPLETIALAALAVVAADPGSVHDPSFQLSFASVAALAVLTKPIRGALPLRPPAAGAPFRARAREWLVGAVCASAAASLGTAAIVACHFRRLPLAGLLSNVPGVPVSSALTVLATAAALVSAISSAAAVPLLWLCGPLAKAMLAVNDAFAELPGAAPALASPGALGASVACAAGLFAWRTRGFARAALVAAALAFLLAPGPVRRWAAASRGEVLEVVFLGVGQGDCAFLRLPDGSAVLVDAGGDAHERSDVGARDVVPFLLDAGVNRLAAVFLSHGDADHVVALPAVAATLPVGAVFTSGPGVDAAAGAMLDGAPAPRHLSAGDTWERAGVRFEVLAPAAGALLDANDASLVLRVVHGRTAILFLGDVEHEGEAALLATAPPGALRSDVVKVPHHGSRTSSTDALVQAALPRIAVISAGFDNRFGFPAPEVEARWERAGAAVARTDRGAIRVLSDGATVRVTPAAAALDALALLGERL